MRSCERNHTKIDRFIWMKDHHLVRFFNYDHFVGAKLGIAVGVCQRYLNPSARSSTQQVLVGYNCWNMYSFLIEYTEKNPVPVVKLPELRHSIRTVV